VWRLWLKVQTQWRVGMALVGLDYPAVLATAQILGIAITQELFEQIQVLEFDVLEEANNGEKKGRN
jgi:hypothetical protein